MKFGKRLQSQLEETLPEWKDKYLAYKQLKKRLKLISAPNCFTETTVSSPEHESGADLSSPEHESGAKAPPEEAHLPADGNGRPAAEMPLLSEGQGSSVNGSSVSGAKSSSGSAGGCVSECLDSEIRTTELSAEEADFIHLLNEELEKFNSFFIEKEEEYVIRLQELKERCERLKEKSSTSMSPNSESGLNEEMINIRKDIVNFHGEMVLLENYSSLNYTGLVKIVKKHDKRTGALLRMPFIRNVLHQPFFTTELLSKLVRECEMNLQSLFPSLADALGVPATTTPNLPKLSSTAMDEPQKHEAQDRYENPPSTEKEPVLPAATQDQTTSHGEDVDNIYRSTLAALRTIKELRRGSSTYSIFSLPPFSKDEDDIEDVKATPCATIPICAKK